MKYASAKLRAAVVVAAPKGRATSAARGPIQLARVCMNWRVPAA